MPYPLNRKETNSSIIYTLNNGKFVLGFFIVCIGCVLFFILQISILTNIFLLLLLGYGVYTFFIFIPFQWAVLRAGWKKKKITEQRLGWGIGQTTIEK